MSQHSPAQCSERGRNKIIEREGLKLRAYKDIAGIWTIGVGHTSRAGVPIVTPDMVITDKEAREIFARDLIKFEKVLNDNIKVAVSQNEFDALCSFIYNVGPGAFIGSSVLRRLNAGDKERAALALLLWNKAGGKVSKGLVNRRMSERAQFLS